jgi:hypothetical protein
MPVTINGTTGISGVDGSNTTPAAQGSDTNTGIFYGADTVSISTGGTSRASVNSDGQVVVSAGTASLPGITTSGDTNTGTFYPAADTIGWTTGGSERARIDSSGNLLVGRTTTVSIGGPQTPTTFIKDAAAVTDGTNTSSYAKDRIVFNTSNYYVLNSSGSTGVVLPSGNTSWSAQSDERVKDIIEPISDAAQKLSTLRTVIGKYKTDDADKRRVFLIAQDVQNILPEAVSKLDDEDETLLLSYTDVIPLLVAAIKELSAKNDALEARIAALEAN